MISTSRLAANLAQIGQQIAEAAARSGRSAEEVKLVAVTKYVTSEVARALFEAGCRDLGESRPQALWQKTAELADLPIVWHLIGHLQRNKVERTLPLVSLIHSGDSLRLLESINAAAASAGRRMPVLVEVNISGESTKHGFQPERLETSLAAIAEFSNLEVRGLMCMASREGDLDQARREFAKLRELRDRLRRVVASQITLDELSMGMSGDFAVAIEEGATLVRIGSALFEGIET